MFLFSEFHIHLRLVLLLFIVLISGNSMILLFSYTLIFPYSSNQLNCFLFADDTKNPRSLEVTVNKELTSLCNWLIMVNKLSLNTKKTNFVIFRLYQKRMNFHVTIKLFDDKNSLILQDRYDYVKYLGVLIDWPPPPPPHLEATYIIYLL